MDSIKRNGRYGLQNKYTVTIISQRKAKTMDNTLFDLGQIIITDKADLVLQRHRMNGLELLDRHTVGDWGDISEADKQANDKALRNGGPLLSAYFLPDESKVFIVTDAEVDDQHHRKATTVLLPEEY
ncbi:MAG: hypothetical protein BWX92_02935 [Deltaproteobacteria bacterium ADurb.Bin135]|nr:MAG: hypothetical protein BWX92_02935 [Deltaproteobacteria bacterium ADurb.Bin135]